MISRILQILALTIAITPSSTYGSECYDRLFPFFSLAPDESKLSFLHLDFENHEESCHDVNTTRKKLQLDLSGVQADNTSIVDDDGITIYNPQFIKLSNNISTHVTKRIPRQKLESRLRKKNLMSNNYLSSPFGKTAIREGYFQHSEFLPFHNALGSAATFVERFESKAGEIYDFSSAEKATFLKHSEGFNFFVDSNIGFSSRMTSNGCWLVAGRSPFLEDKWPINAKVYSLHSRKKSETSHLNEKRSGMCRHPLAWPHHSNKDREALGDLLPVTDNKKHENGRWAGIDFDILSENVDELEFIWQAGFERDSNSEKFRSGDILHNTITFTVNGSKVTSPRNLTKTCKNKIPTKYEGFERSPTFSHNGRLIYFLAEKVKGDESSSLDLYVGSIEELKKGNCKDLVNLTENIDFPVTQFQVTENGTELSTKIIYNGRTRILFYAIEETRSTARILYKYKHEISNFGFVFDYKTEITNGLGVEKKNVYVSASHTDFPTSIYKCNWKQDSIDCGSKYHPLATNTLGNVIRKEVDQNLPIVRYLEFPQVRRGSLLTSDEQIHFNKETHRFVLLPKSYDKDACIDHTLGKIENAKACPPVVLSIHGGPADAWTSVFSIREYHLAELGYIVVLPNPIGSIGFGQQYTNAVLNNWGSERVDMPGNTYHKYLGPLGQLKKVICQFSTSPIFCDSSKDLDPNFLSSGPVYALGHSYGGYMVNWMQSQGLKLPAFVSVNGLFDLRWFADTTDQLWFPDFQLGCADSSSNLKCTYQFSCKEVKPNGDNTIVDQNPSCYLKPFNKNMSRFLAVFGSKDSRVPPANTTDFLKSDKRMSPEKRSMSKQRMFEHGDHGLGDGENRELANDLSCWFESIDVTTFNHHLSQMVAKKECERRLTENITGIKVGFIEQTSTDQQYKDQSFGSFQLLTNSFR